MKKNPQGKWWRRLDNTGKIFPLIANENLSNVFRITATLKEDVRPELLQRALEDVGRTDSPRPRQDQRL